MRGRLNLFQCAMLQWRSLHPYCAAHVIRIPAPLDAARLESRIARALEPYGILFLEDVLPPVHVDEIALFARRTSIPIVGSELLMTRWQLREWMEKHAVGILMTDVVWNGGIGETRKIAAMAEAYGLPLVLHNVAGPICHAACLHLGVQSAPTPADRQAGEKPEALPLAPPLA